MNTPHSSGVLLTRCTSRKTRLLKRSRSTNSLISVESMRSTFLCRSKMTKRATYHRVRRDANTGSTCKLRITHHPVFSRSACKESDQEVLSCRCRSCKWLTPSLKAGNDQEASNSTPCNSKGSQRRILSPNSRHLALRLSHVPSFWRWRQTSPLAVARRIFSLQALSKTFWRIINFRPRSREQTLTAQWTETHRLRKIKKRFLSKNCSIVSHYIRRHSEGSKLTPTPNRTGQCQPSI